MKEDLLWTLMLSILILLAVSLGVKIGRELGYDQCKLEYTSSLNK